MPPDRVLRLAWAQEQLLGQVRIITEAEPPAHFFVRVKRENPELTHLAFHAVNLTPFKLSIVAVSGTVSLDSRNLFTHEQRLATEIQLPPFATPAFELRHSLTEPQADRLRSYSLSSARIMMQSGVIVRTPFGECRKRFSCDWMRVLTDRRSTSDAHPFLAPDLRQPAPSAATGG